MALQFKGELKAVDFINNQESMIKQQLLNNAKLMGKDAGVSLQDILQMGYADYNKSVKAFQEKYQLGAKYSDFLGK